MFVLGMQSYLDWTIHLTTVEGCEPQFTLAHQRLKQRYQDAITCHFGWTQDVLPKLMSTLGPIDFMFHDAGHTREGRLRQGLWGRGGLALAWGGRRYRRYPLGRCLIRWKASERLSGLVGGGRTRPNSTCRGGEWHNRFSVAVVSEVDPGHATAGAAS
jgi:hypothetical protein